MHVECGQSYVDATPNDEPIESVKYYISVMMEMPQHCLEFWVGDHVIMEDNRLINSYFSSEESDMYTVYVLDKRSNRLTYLCERVKTAPHLLQLGVYNNKLKFDH
ncbi:hypothetical protein GGI26_006196 [Coemansia sp. RSA 1358]|nr:hypothetical protein GGI26_006196 [Coemansia sp. RSA 1358]